MTLSNYLKVRNNKESFERVRRELRKVQNAKTQQEMVGLQKKDQYEIVRIKSFLKVSVKEMEAIQNKQERILRENNRMLDQAKSVGLACEEQANDIKFNLAK